MRVKQKVSIITGGARGIGRAAVELFASEGAIVYAVDLSFEEPFESESVRSVHMDVTSSGMVSWRMC
jgi:NAD(P)-dependent dehydrogenase (short-subunit alcohol dehydrogenase family)